MSLREALDRTLLLMRDEIDNRASDEMMIAALIGTSVAIITDARNIASHSAQSAFITAALLAARSGHNVTLIAPNVEMVGPQPPLKSGRLVDRLMEAGNDLLPGITFSTELPRTMLDLALMIGSSPNPVTAFRSYRLNAGAWTGHLRGADDTAPWGAAEWPLGGMTAGAMAATEAFKTAMRKLSLFARNPRRMTEVFAPSDVVSFALAPEDTPFHVELGVFDSVSGGAITNAVLFALLRLPGVRGKGRVIEPDRADLSNLNRYALLLRSADKSPKARELASIASGLIELTPIYKRFDAALVPSLPGGLAENVIVGVDDIPSRWAVQAAGPAWLGIGATSHWSTMASFHVAGAGCARCLHNEDYPGTGAIPTVAFVSFWAGLLTACYFIRHLAGADVPSKRQQIFLTPLRPENPVWSAVPVRPTCPTCQGHGAWISQSAIAAELT